ncbi:MAG TPA: hypothetical protein VHM65_04255 [Candidatus Lustribacter sp.]|jgi:hypothetical protein|nr:hypothetical protein [Candidatus Lustribacter sp.]
MPRIRKILLWVLFAFIVYAVYSSPAQAGDIVRSAWEILGNAVTAIGRFFRSMLGQ